MTAAGRLASAAFVDQDGALLEDHDDVLPVARLVESAAGDPSALLASLAVHAVPPGAADRIVQRLAPAVAGSDAWSEAVAADRRRAERFQRAVALLEEALRPLGDGVALASSELGPLWWRDVDVLVSPELLADADEALRAAGFLPLDPLLVWLGRTGGARRYAAMDAEPLCRVELSVQLHERGPAAEEAIARARRPAGDGLPRLAAVDRLDKQAAKIVAGRRATLRGVLELAALRDELGSGPTALARRRYLVWTLARARNVRRRLARRLRARRLVVAFSGIDGSGKSTQAARLADSLMRVDVPAVAVWGRIGFSGSPLLTAAARLGRRVLPAGSHSAQRARAQGTGGAAPLTRRGPIGWTWALGVTIAYLRVVRAGVRRGRGRVVVLDRGLPDALIDLEKGFAGELRLGMHRRLIRRLAPRADVTFYLRLSGSAAHERKRDLFAPSVLESYAERFDQVASELGAVLVDAERPAEEIARDVLRAVAELAWRTPTQDA